MELKEFLYELPRALVAAHPAAKRDASRLMVVDRAREALFHATFAEIGNFLRPGDLLVLNDTRVLPARLRGEKEGGGRAEVLLVEAFPDLPHHWIALVRCAKPPRVGSRIHFAEGASAQVIGDMGRGRYGLRFRPEEDFLSVLERIGEPPLPPYVEKARAAEPGDRERYQTVYARNAGSIAAPTAGFHFSDALLEELGARGIERAFVTLHVGPGTFSPVRAERVEQHRMEGEWYAISGEAAEKIARAKERGGRVVAVGTTSTRALEWVAQKRGSVSADRGIARLFIHPGHRFRAIDALVTNFHLPGSTPLILVAAFAGVALVQRAYREAVRLGYRFYSYGDAMLVV
jgi:S-adenosylmethionine:tRNA ribosyltransferase-isomerase